MTVIHHAIRVMSTSEGFYKPWKLVILKCIKVGPVQFAASPSAKLLSEPGLAHTSKNLKCSQYLQLKYVSTWNLAIESTEFLIHTE